MIRYQVDPEPTSLGFSASSCTAVARGFYQAWSLLWRIAHVCLIWNVVLKAPRGVRVSTCTACPKNRRCSEQRTASYSSALILLYMLYIYIYVLPISNIRASCQDVRCPVEALAAVQDRRLEDPLQNRWCSPTLQPHCQSLQCCGCGHAGCWVELVPMQTAVFIKGCLMGQSLGACNF